MVFVLLSCNVNLTKVDSSLIVVHCGESAPVSTALVALVNQFFSSISMAPLSVSRQFKKYYFIFKAKSRLGRYIFKIKVQ